MRRARIALLVGASLVGGACGADAGVPAGSAVEVSDAWTAPTPVMGSVAVVSFRVTSPRDDAIVGVEIPRGIAVDAVIQDGGGAPGAGGHDHAAMAAAPSITVPLQAGRTTTFTEDDRHVMLRSLEAPLADGDLFPMTLRLESGARVTATVTVRDGSQGS